MALAVALLLSGIVGCAGDEAAATRAPFIVIGFDGGEWSVIRALWKRGRLPNLKSIAERGVTAELATAYGVSPVIWTTIATGHEAMNHGITDFVVEGPEGRTPVNSSLRRVPALWNMLTLAERRVAVLGWYATWPVEAINGVMVTDHVMRGELMDRVYPAELLSQVESGLAAVREMSLEETYPFGVALNDRRVARDLLLERLAPEVAAEGYDLLLVYFRVIDHLSHHYWKFWEPERYDDIDPVELKKKRDWIPAGYERFDRAVGAILAAAPDSNIVILSDHGFHAAEEDLSIYLALDTLLHHLGYLKWGQSGVDKARSLAWTFGTSMRDEVQTLRIAPPSAAADKADPEAYLRRMRRRLTDDLTALRYSGGKPLLEALPDDERPGLLSFRALEDGFSPEVTTGDGRVLRDVLNNSIVTSGGHLPDTPGVFIAAGPSIGRRGADGISIFDVAPTVLYGLDLPVADDFAGRAFVEMYRSAFRNAHALQTVASWGEIEPGALRDSAADQEIIEELEALGYLQ